jgi:hypothetical protein
MGNISTGVLEIAAGWLMENIVWDYECIPQIILNEGRIGFNVGGLEAGCVGKGEDGDIHGIYYAPGSQPLRSVFS